MVLIGSGAVPALAQNATWSPIDNNFNSAGNWTPAAVPTGTATFGASTQTSLTISGVTLLGGWTFQAGAPNYTFGNANALGFNGAGIIGNGGTVTINNNGNAASVNFLNSATAGNAIINNNAASIFFSDTSHAGTATINSTGMVSFSDSSRADASTIISSGNTGNLQFLNNANAGSATIVTGNGSSVFFGGQSSGGTSRQVVNAGGIFDISLVTPVGFTIGSLEGAGAVRLGGNTLIVGGNGLSTTFAGVIQDGGNNLGTGASLVKVGAGTLVLSGVNTYTGTTTINGGTLQVDGSITDPTVNAGGTLAGTGTVGPTQVNAGGTLAPGNAANPTGTLTITGNLAFQSGAIYLVQVTATAAASANVTGTATLGGATVNAAFANGGTMSKQYTILTAAGGVSGKFAPGVANTNLPQNFTDTLSYDATHAYLNLTLGFAGPNFSNGLNVNQQNVASTLVNFFNRTGGIPMALGTLTPAGLTQASGELGTGSQQTTFDAMNQFMGLLTDPFMNRSGGAPSPPGASGYAEGGDGSAYAASRKTDAFAMFTKAPPAPFVPRWSVWTAGFGGSQSTDGNAATGSNNTTSNVYGTAVGADYLFSPNTIAGFALAGGGTNFSVANSGSGHSDLFQAGAYVRHTEGPAYISAALAYGWQDITTNRTVGAAGLDQLRAEFDANAFSGRLEGGYRFVAPWVGGVGITPYAAGQFTTFDLPAYAESVLSGAGTFALAYGAKDVTDTRSEIGIRTDKSFAVQGGIFTLRGRFAWTHDYDPDRSAAATFQALPGASFVVNGAVQAADSALTTASAEMKWTNNWSVAAIFEGEFSNVTSSYAGKGVARYQW